MTSVPSTKPRLLLVDDEPSILRTINRVVGDKCETYTATNAEDALGIIRTKNIHVIVSDQRMPKVTGVELLKKVSVLSPNTLRLLLTGYSDLDAVEASINNAEVFRFINKPWKNADLVSTITEAGEIAMKLMSAPREPQEAAGLKQSVSKEASSKSLLPKGALLKSALPKVRRPKVVAFHTDSPRDFRDAISTANTNLQRQVSVERVHSWPQLNQILDTEDVSVLLVYLSSSHNERLISQLSALKRAMPSLMVVALSPEQDKNQLLELINHCQAYRYHSLPVKQGVLRLSLLSAVEYHRKLKLNTSLQHKHGVLPMTQDHSYNGETGFLSFLKKALGLAKQTS